ncbi:MAG: radical SAM protein [candidate division WOR-3 bacterium]
MLREIKAKQVLTKSGISNVSYSLNPYIGCFHRCLYCYADFIGKWRDVLPWGEIIEVKVNLLERLKEEVRRKKRGEVCIGTVCDPYQPIEERYQLTRNAIKVLKDANFPITILTKSSLCLRDIDLLKGNAKIWVEMTLTTLDEETRKIFEPNAPAVQERIEALKELKKSGIKTTLFFGPVLPYFSDREEVIREIFSLGEKVGVAEILVDKLNYLNRKFFKIKSGLGKYPEAIRYYERVNQSNNFYTDWLRERLLGIAKDFPMPIRIIF